VRLYPDLTVRIIEAVAAHCLDGGCIGVAKPGLVGSPRLEKLDL
jgi:hypothetical protein